MGALLYKSPCINAVKRPTLNRKLFVSTVKYMLIKFNTQKKRRRKFALSPYAYLLFFDNCTTIVSAIG